MPTDDGRDEGVRDAWCGLRRARVADYAADGRADESADGNRIGAPREETRGAERSPFVAAEDAPTIAPMAAPFRAPPDPDLTTAWKSAVLAASASGPGGGAAALSS
jgi:hypothetical protein